MREVKEIIRDRDNYELYSGTINIDNKTHENMMDFFNKNFANQIDHPAHYNHGNVETIDKIKTMLTAEEFKGFLKGNIIKYIDRADYKGHKEEDLGKADWYLRKLKEEEK